MVYYNEFDPFAAAWLRELIHAGAVAPGEVDERSIVDVSPSDLAGYTQCHFFAGIGGWSAALRLAGWPDDRPVWTGSCPCQPFSAAGGRTGFDDERHLWPHFFWLIQQCRPVAVFGEQVASKDGLAWLDLVHADLEGADYACGAVDLCAAGVGAPHLRQRLYWVADTDRRGFAARSEGCPPLGHGQTAGADCRSRSLGDPGSTGSSTRERATLCGAGRREEGRAVEQPSGAPGGVADTDGQDTSAQREQRSGQQRLEPQDGSALDDRRPGPTNGRWRDADWLLCRDGKWRPVEPGTFPLASGLPARVGRLRGYGNAIVPEVAQIFIEAYLEVSNGRTGTA